MNDYDRLAAAIGHAFADPALLRQALTHRSAGSPHYERLEFLGDSVLSLVVSELLYQRFPRAREGQLTRMRSSIVRGPTLAKIARALGVGGALHLGGGELKSGGFDRDSILADAVEAIIGALYLDGGMPVAAAFIQRRFGTEIDAVNPDKPNKDAKTRLQEVLQARGLGLPEYRIVAESGASHDRHFVVGCDCPGIDGEVRGEGGSRRRAEQDAANRALASLAGNTASSVASRP